MIIVSILDSRFSIRRYLSAHASTCDSIFWFTEATVGFGMCPPYVNFVIAPDAYDRLKLVPSVYVTVLIVTPSVVDSSLLLRLGCALNPASGV